MFLRFHMGWGGCPQAEFLTQVVLHLVEDVSHANPRVVCLALGHSLDHYFRLNIYLGRGLRHNMRELLHNVPPEDRYEIFRALE